MDQEINLKPKLKVSTFQITKNNKNIKIKKLLKYKKVKINYKVI
jgi:hypothetical protein